MPVNRKKERKRKIDMPVNRKKERKKEREK